MKHERVIAVWNTFGARNNFGSMLIFLAELEATTNNFKIVDVACIGLNNNPSLFLSVMRFFSRVNNILFFSDQSEFAKYSSHLETEHWLNIVDNFKLSSCNESTLFLQNIYKANKDSRRLNIPEYLRPEVDLWLNKYCDGYKPVVVHLKNNPNDLQSNANFESWSNFFLHVLNKKYKVKFNLIGNDEIDKRVSNLSNVIVTKENGGNTELDIALVLSAFLFLGMSSGPCNAAIFSDVPYIIWKHPEHHAEEMNRELKDNNSFSFSSENQLFFREYDELQSLIENFEAMYLNIT